MLRLQSQSCITDFECFEWSFITSTQELIKVRRRKKRENVDFSTFSPFSIMRHRGFEPRTTWLKVKCSTDWANIPSIHLLNKIRTVLPVLSGRRWIRTTEASCSRFTVCPLWPLGNSPIFNFFPSLLGAGRRTRSIKERLARCSPAMLIRIAFDCSSLLSASSVWSR